jgi:hypothetical protein
MHCVLLAALVVTAVAADSGTPVGIAPLVAAERAFAEETGARGWSAGVRAFADPEAVVLNPGPANALSTLPATSAEGGSPLQWWPAYAGIARSLDLGFTTGPFFIRGKGYVGNYFTVWRKSSGGDWKWIFDGGVDVLDDAPPASDAAVEQLPLAARDGESERVALQDVQGLEAALAADADRDAPAAIARMLAADGRVNRAFQPRAVGREASREILADHAAAIRFESLGGSASRSGDLVFTYGSARWKADGEQKLGYYARIWQLRPEGWRLAFDQIVPHREPPPGD